MAIAEGQWPRLLGELAGLAPEQLQNRHQPCPACGGTDRYRWDRDDGPGGWFCNQFGGKERTGGGGDGMDLLLRLTGWEFADAARRIEAHLALPGTQNGSRRHSAPMLRIPRPPLKAVGSASANGHGVPGLPTRAAGHAPGVTTGPSASAAPAAAKRPARIPEAPPPDSPPPELGRAVGQWCYRNPEGEPLFWIQRLESSSAGKPRKLFVHRTWLDGRWHFPSRRDGFSSEWPAPRPLYRLPELGQRPWLPVLVVEGEKTADAAAALLPDHVVVSWCNGSRALHTADWRPLAGRRVTLWPDADAAGRQAMAALSGLLLPLVDALFVVLPPETSDFPEGWDLADADWTPEQTLAFLEAHSRPVRQQEGNPLLRIPESAGEAASEGSERASVDPASAPAASAWRRACRRTAKAAGRGSQQRRSARPGHRPAEMPSAASSSAPAAAGPEAFSCLGYDTDGYYYQPSSTGQVVRLAASSHGGMNLCRLAPVAYWEALYPSRTGVNWTAAASDLFSRQAAVGMFDPDRLRGRGTWWDRGRCVLHLGDRLVVDGIRQVITAPLESTFHYQRGAALIGPGDATPLSDEEALTVLTMADRFWWDVPASAFLMAGWLALAPICGALRWRPHLWLTAAAGSGKTTLLERFVGVLLGDMSLLVVGSSTEAGIRQSLRSDALPVVLDEAECNEKLDQQRIQAILALTRVASSESHASTVKGSPGGDVARFQVRSMFLLASIAIGLKQGADRRRFAQLTLRNPAEIAQHERDAHWQALDRDLEALITQAFAERLLARTVSLIPVIRQAVQVFTRVATQHFDSQALGDQYGTLLAGAWSLQSSVVPTQEQAQSLIDGTDWSSYRQATELADERRCLNRILQHQLRVETDDRSAVTRTILELVEIVAATVHSPMEVISPTEAGKVLCRHGLRVRDRELLISNNAEALARILDGTAWSNSWATILLRLPQASRCGPLHFHGLGSARAVGLPLAILGLGER
jgi:putative DNA primase/helicase